MMTTYTVEEASRRVEFKEDNTVCEIYLEVHVFFGLIACYTQVVIEFDLYRVNGTHWWDTPRIDTRWFDSDYARGDITDDIRMQIYALALKAAREIYDTQLKQMH